MRFGPGPLRSGLLAWVVGTFGPARRIGITAVLKYRGADRLAGSGQRSVAEATRFTVITTDPASRRAGGISPVQAVLPVLTLLPGEW